MSRNRNREAKRELIRKATYRCFRDHGYAETSIDRVCAEAGISKGSFYWHYESKQAVFVDLVDTWAHQVMTEVFGQFEESASKRHELASQLVMALMKEARRGRAIVPIWMELSVMGQREPALKASLAKVYRRARYAIAELIESITPFLSDEERYGLAGAIFGVFIGIVMQGVVDEDDASSEAMFAGFISVIGKWLQWSGTWEWFDQQPSTEQTSPSSTPDQR